MALRDKSFDVVEKHFRDKLSPRIIAAISLLNSDLYYGPFYYDSKEVPDADDLEAIRAHECTCFDENATALDFQSLAGEVANELEAEIPWKVWVDMDCEEVLTREPEGYEEDCDCKGEDDDCEECKGTGKVWIEPYWENTFEFDFGDVKQALLGSELAATI
jgi:hypothetical protein